MSSTRAPQPECGIEPVGLDTQAEHVIATMTKIRLLAVSPDALELATLYDGTEGTLETHLDLKKLPPL